MKTIANRGDYLNAVTDYTREWSNEVVITDGVHTETYTSCEIKITTPFSQDALSMGQSFTKELDLTIKQPERTLIYNLATIKVYSKLKVGESFVTVQMGEYFPSEATTNDDYFSLNIKAYDMMGKLDVPYVPNYTNVYDMSCDSKLYYVEDGELQSFPAGRSLPSIRTGGDLTFVNNSDITAWICAKVDGVWVGRTMFDDTTGKLEPNQTLTISCSEYIVSFTSRYYGGVTVNGQDLAPMTTLGVVIDMSRQFSFLNSAFYEVEIDTIYEGTCAEILGWFAGMSGKNAVFNDEGRLVFKWYTVATREGGRWLDYPVTWATVENKTWANTTSQITGMNITRTEQKERGANLNEGEFTIASITSGTEENPLTVGEGKGISFENPYMTEERLTVIGNRELGKKTAVGTVNTFGNPLLEVGDIVGVVDKQGDIHDFFISKMEWNLTGGCSCIITATGNADAEIEFSNVSPMEKKITKVKSVLQGVVERFSNLINSLVGYYTITEENGIPTGWTIKDDLNNPVNMIKCSLGGIGISSNGGQTYKTAITGEGINADTITAGTIHAIRYESLYSQEWFGIDYTLADASRMEAIMGGEPPTQADLDKYDFLMNGDFYDTGYAFACEELIVQMAGGDPIEKLTLEIGFQITPDDARVLEILVDLYETRTDSSVVHIWGFPKTVFSTSSFCTSFANGILKCTSFNTTGALTPDYSDDGKITLDEGLFQFRTRNSRTGNMQENGYIKGTGYASFVNVTQTSRESIKKNIKPFSADALSIVNDAEIYKFNFKSDEKDEMTHLGFVIPDEGGNYKVPDIVCNKEKTGIDTYSMSSILWKAVQELSIQVDGLTKEVEELRGGNNVPD